MNCLKTGAHVVLLNYGRSLVCDLYQVGNCVVLRSNRNGLEFAPPSTDPHVAKYATHTMHVPDFDSFARDDIGIYVVPVDYVQEIGETLLAQESMRIKY